MSRTLRRRGQSAAHYKKAAIQAPSEFRPQVRNRPYSSFQPGELQHVMETKFHSDNFPTSTSADEAVEHHRQIRKERHETKVQLHVVEPEVLE